MRCSVCVSVSVSPCWLRAVPSSPASPETGSSVSSSPLRRVHPQRRRPAWVERRVRVRVHMCACVRVRISAEPRTKLQVLQEEEGRGAVRSGAVDGVCEQAVRGTCDLRTPAHSI